MKRARRQEIELAVQDHRWRCDGAELRGDRLKVEKGLHEVLQGIDIVGEPALPLHGFQIAKQRAVAETEQP